MCEYQINHSEDDVQVFKFPRNFRVDGRKPFFLIAYHSYHYAIIQTGSRLEWYFRLRSLYKTVLFASGTFDVGITQCYEQKVFIAALKTYGNIYSCDCNIGVSNLVSIVEFGSHVNKVIQHCLHNKKDPNTRASIPLN